MRKAGFMIELRKKEEEKECSKNFVSGIEALARMTDRFLSDAVNETELDFNAYVDALYEISNHTDKGDYDTAIELTYLLALMLDEDVKSMIEGVIYQDEDAARIFLDYFNEYIADGYVLERMIQESGSDDEEPIQEDRADSLDDEYCCLKSALDKKKEDGHEDE